MATFLLLHGAGSDGWYWSLVAPRLEQRGHTVVAPDLPVDDPGCGISEYAEAAVAALASAHDERDDLVVVAQSLAGLVAPVVCARVPVRLLVLVAAMIPMAGESAGDWWDATGQVDAARAAALADGRDPDAPFDAQAIFGHDVPDAVLAAMDGHVLEQTGTPFERAYPLPPLPTDVAVRAVIGRNDRFFPPAFERRILAERLGVEPDVIESGHLPALARPAELADLLLGYLGGGGTRDP